MAKFKVGDRVSLTGLRGQPLTGVVSEEGADGSGRFATVLVDVGCGYHVPDVVRYYTDPADLEQMALIESAAPKPKTIPARNLSGKHIGRVVTVTTKAGAVISDELRLVCSESGTDGSLLVRAELKNSEPRNTGDLFRVTFFDLDPESEVIVK